MTREQYFEMCEAMGTAPVDSEIPVEYEDLPLDVQEAYDVYHMLTDNWDTMSGNYLGKSMVGLKDIMDIQRVEDQPTILAIIKLIDSARTKSINAKKQNKVPPAG